MSEEPEETNSGVKKKGDWEEIAEFGEEVEEVVRDSADDSSVEKFNEWRPRVEESEKDIKRKTVEEATIKESRMEKDSNGVKEDLGEASEKLGEAGDKVRERKVPEEEIAQASEKAVRPFFSNIAAVFRKLESWIYSLFTLRFNPYYLDTQDFSVDIKQKKDEFEMDVSVPEEEKREELKENFRGE